MKAGQVLVVLFPLLDGAEHLTGPVIELTAPGALAGEVAQLDHGATMAGAFEDAPIGVTLDIFHTVLYQVAPLLSIPKK